MKLAAIFLVAALAACSSTDASDRALQFAAAHLGEPRAALRVTNQSDLTGERHRFFLVTRSGGPSIVVVVPATGEPFSSDSDDAFGRVSRAEDTVNRLSRIGAERVALWFGVLGGQRCPLPASDDAHFATVERLPDGLRLAYPAGKSAEMSRTCTIELNPDGSLRDAHLVEQKSSHDASSRRWKSRT